MLGLNYKKFLAWVPPPHQSFYLGLTLPPSLTKVLTRKKSNLRKEKMIWAIFGKQFFGSQTPPPPHNTHQTWPIPCK